MLRLISDSDIHVPITLSITPPPHASYLIMSSDDIFDAPLQWASISSAID